MIRRASEDPEGLHTNMYELFFARTLPYLFLLAHYTFASSFYSRQSDAQSLDRALTSSPLVSLNTQS